MSRLLVTGGAGFIGANFVHYCLSHHPGDRVLVLDALTYAGNLVNLAPVSHHGSFRFVQGDIGDERLVEQLLIEERIDTIVHFAAETHVDRSISGPDPFIETNVLGTHSLLKVATRVWLEGSSVKSHRFHHVSTDEVYGSLDADDPAFTERTPYAPNSPYAASKAASDHLVRAYHKTHGLQVTTSNCSNNYGAYQFPEKLIPLFVINILLGRPLPVYGDGRNVRDWLYVEDHCRGIDTVLREGRVGETYNIGGQNEWQNIDVVNLLCELVDESFAKAPALKERFPRSPAVNGESASLVQFVADRPGHDRRYALSTEKASADLGFEPRETFETGVRHTLDWYLNNEAWWRAVMDGSYRRWMMRQYGIVG